jgi:hypothetical protein
VVVVIDARAAHGTSGFKGATWGATEVMDAARGAAEVSEAGDEGAAQVLEVGPPRVVV